MTVLNGQPGPQRLRCLQPSYVASRNSSPSEPPVAHACTQIAGIIAGVLIYLGGRKTRRTRPRDRKSAAPTPTAPLTLNTDVLLSAKSGDTADLARDMLMRLKSDGFETMTPSTPTAASRRRTRRKRDSEGVAALAALEESISPGGPLRDDLDTPIGTGPPITLDSIEEHPSPSS